MKQNKSEKLLKGNRHRETDRDTHPKWTRRTKTKQADFALNFQRPRDRRTARVCDLIAQREAFMAEVP